MSIGLTYLPLAEQTISSLERWSQSTALNLPTFYDQILPYLDDFLRLSHDQGENVNVRAIISSLQEKTRLNSKSKHALPTRMLKKTKQIKHVCFLLIPKNHIVLFICFYSYSKIVIFVEFNFVF